jgi:hypothetical protein
MKSIIESFVEEFGSYDMAKDKEDWSKMLKVFEKGWLKGIIWNQQVTEKYKDFPYADSLHGEKDENNHD